MREVIASEATVNSLRLRLFTAVSQQEREQLMQQYEDAQYDLDDKRRFLEEARAGGPEHQQMKKAEMVLMGLRFSQLVLNTSAEAAEISKAKTALAAALAFEATVGGSAEAVAVGDAAAAAEARFMEQRAFQAGNESQWYEEAKRQLDEAQYVQEVIEVSRGDTFVQGVGMLRVCRDVGLTPLTEG